MEAPQASRSPAGIGSRLHCANQGDLTPKAAQFFLPLGFDPQDVQQMHERTVKNQDGVLAPAEQDELCHYGQIGLQLDLLRANAHLSPSVGR
jgi:hypothetical protein